MNGIEKEKVVGGRRWGILVYTFAIFFLVGAYGVIGSNYEQINHIANIQLRESVQIRSLRDLEREVWHELSARSGSLLGSSFRVFANRAALDWISEKTDDHTNAEFLKLNLGTYTEQSDSMWRTARLETVRSYSIEPELYIWKFYSFGPMQDASTEARALPPENCLQCHQRTQWRGQPLFLSFYLDRDGSTNPSRLHVIKEGRLRKVLIAPIMN